MARRMKNTADSRLGRQRVFLSADVDIQHPKDDDLKCTNSLISVEYSQLPISVEQAKVPRCAPASSR